MKFNQTGTEIENPIDSDVLPDLVAQQMACWHVMKSSFWAHLCEVAFGRRTEKCLDFSF